MGASDYMVGNAPGGVSYAAPLMDFSSIGNLGKDYQQGQQYARQRELQKPILDPATGQPSTDFDTITKALLQRGGAEYAKDLLPTLVNRQIGQGNADVLSGNSAGGAQPQPQPQPQAPLPNGQTFAPQ